MSFMVIGAGCSIVKFRLYGRLVARVLYDRGRCANLLRLVFALYYACICFLHMLYVLQCKSSKKSKSPSIRLWIICGLFTQSIAQLQKRASQRWHILCLVRLSSFFPFLLFLFAFFPFPLFCLIPCFFSLLALSHPDSVLAKPFFKTDKDGEREGVSSLVMVPFWCCHPYCCLSRFPEW